MEMYLCLLLLDGILYCLLHLHMQLLAHRWGMWSTRSRNECYDNFLTLLCTNTYDHISYMDRITTHSVTQAELSQQIDVYTKNYLLYLLLENGSNKTIGPKII